MTRTASELAEYLGATLEGDPRAQISGVASPERARAGDLIYLDSPRHQPRAAGSAATCVLAPRATRLAGKTILEVNEPKFAFAKAAHWLLPESAPAAAIHPTAIVAPNAKIGARVSIGAYVVIEEEAEIGGQTVIEAFCFLGRRARLGENCRLHPRVTLYAGSHLGHRVEVHSGVVIGADGFGYVFGEGRHWKFPQIGAVEIGDDVEIGANATIDRGSLESTEIGNGVKIDNLVQVAHNVRVGEHSILAAQTGVSGSSIIGTRVIVGGQVGIADHCKIEDGAIVGAQAGIPTGKTIRGGQTVWGTPARPLEKFKEQYAWFARLPDLAERVRRLEERKQSR
ncbi:MAG TPA: UDP-3-O-(3-hydroxymyristoyl)glucosamine N-acyltransferase [Candidatus Acidoferrales bacterium]|jgi:UDP-3-O-[3-hydroxymyristoyl] glucosamine N-acyltransferase|nr:UDP-3-O-(3-hydroxymyristoyl)glucosamine N-acyltransferase [Candidatus Acidoferrales bacterium]